MHSRALYSLSILLLLFSLAGCAKKSDDAANSANQNQMNQGGSNTNGSNNSGSNMAGSNMGGSNAGSAPAPAPQPVVVPAGTTLTVRLGESVGSKISSPGQTFRATLAHDVTVDGSPVIARGSAVTGTVVDAKPLGRFKGGASLELRLTSITVQGTERRIQTAAMTTEEKGKGKRTAVMTGGGAGLGALIGGLAGGGKGAAIGAAAGAGAGVGGAAFTGNKEIVFPAESALSFKLRSSLEVTPRQ
jgi:predicted small lipoprotein YifL